MTNSNVRYDLLQALSEHLRTVAPDLFDLSYWRCGTTACAVGHAVDVPLIAAQGFTLLKVGYYVNLRPTLGCLKDWEAVQALFGLTFQDCSYLFSHSEYPHEDMTTATEVADRIDNFILTSKVTL